MPGWRGPVVLDVQESIGTAVATWQARPYVVSLRHLRPHASHAVALHVVNAQGSSAVYKTDHSGLRNLTQLMDYADAEALGKILTYGMVYVPGTQTWRQDHIDHPVMSLAASVAKDFLRSFRFDALKLGTAVRRIPPVPACVSGVLIVWSRTNRMHYRTVEVTPSKGINLSKVMPGRSSFDDEAPKS